MSSLPELAIVGAGPIGLELAVALKREKISYIQFDARQIGYTISWFAPETRFFSSNERISIAGVPLYTPDQSKASREQYLAYLRTVAAQFDLRVKAYESVTNISKSGDAFDVQTSRGKYCARRVVLATGGTERPRRLNIPGEDLPHVSHYFQDPHNYFRQRLLIVGGKNSAVEAAIRCHNAGAQVCLVHRQNQIDADRIKYWLWPELNGLLKSKQMLCHFNAEMTEIREKSVLLRQGDEIIEAPADFVLLLIGYEADMKLFKLAGVKLNTPALTPDFNESTMETNVPGIYVAGTATGGTQQRFEVFLENCHVHVERIVNAITGRSPPPAPKANEQLET